jgi:hypothetical protein
MRTSGCQVSFLIPASIPAGVFAANDSSIVVSRNGETAKEETSKMGAADAIVRVDEIETSDQISEPTVIYERRCRPWKSLQRICSGKLEQCLLTAP